MMTEVLNSEVLYGVDSVEQLLLGVKMQDSKYTGWQGGTVVMMLGDNGAEVALHRGNVPGRGRYRMATVWGVNSAR